MEYKLNPDEFQYLAAKLGAERVEGVTDNLITLGGTDLQDRLMEIEKDLEKKEYMSYDFNGDCDVNAGLKKIIENILSATGQIMVEHKKNGEEHEEKVFFIDNGNCAMIERQSGEYILKTIENDLIKNSIYLGMTCTEIDDDTIYMVKESLVQKISSFAKHGNEKNAVELLKEQEIPVEVCNVIVDSLVERVDVRSRVFIKTNETQNETVSLMVIGNDDLYSIQPAVAEDNEDAIEIRRIGQNEVNSILTKGMEIVGLKE